MNEFTYSVDNCTRIIIRGKSTDHGLIPDPEKNREVTRKITNDEEDAKRIVEAVKVCMERMSITPIFAFRRINQGIYCGIFNPRDVNEIQLSINEQRANQTTS